MMIELKNVSKIYRDTGVCALENLNLQIQKGEFVFLIGATGAGKTSLIKLLLREETADRGQVMVDGKELYAMPKRQIPLYRRKIGVVFQDFRLLPDRSVYENVAFAMQVVGASPKRIAHIVPQVLSLVGLSEKADQRPMQLSGGEKQRAAMARALVNDPPLLIADEPTGNLDPKTSEEIVALLDKINRLGTTVIMATHARELVDRMQRRVIALENGKMISDQKQGGYCLA